MDVKDKIIVVTGAASGIGRALVVRFKAEGAKQIVAVDLNLAGAQETAAMVGCLAMSADVSVEADIQRVMRTRSLRLDRSICFVPMRVLAWARI